MTRLNGLQAQNTAPSALPLNPAAAKRLIGVMGAGDAPVTLHGRRVLAVQQKRHPYDMWHDVKLAGNIDTQNHAMRYRAVLQCTPTGAAR